MNPITRLSLVDRTDAELSIVAQCRLLKVARSSLYWRPAAVSEDDLPPCVTGVAARIGSGLLGAQEDGRGSIRTAI